MNSETIKKNGFNLEWQNNNTEHAISKDEFYEMRDWQLNAFEQLKSEPYMILNAPMGSGKSWMMCLLSYFKMKKDNLIRCVIVVPQTIIASGFADAKFQMHDGEKIHWKIKHNLCKEEPSAGTVSYFIKWLENSPTIFSDRSILCTHATLVMVYKKLKSENRLHLFNNILLWIDEAHHVKNIIAEGFQNTVINNNIGEVVTYFLDNVNDNLQIGLTTASFFRGDRASLLTDNMEEKFKRFNLPYDEYLRSMKHLKSFSFDFLLSGHNYIKAIEMLVQNKKGKDIIYIPHPISQYSTGNKHQEVENIISIYGKKSHITEDSLMIVQGNSRECKVLDLVSETQRKQKKNYLDNPIVKKEPSALDVIITLGMFKEGANWIYANRSIIVGARSSLVDVIQMVGRLFRDAKDKNHVEVIQLLPFSLDQQDKESFRENLNNYLKAIYASLILENILNPVKIKSMQKKEREKNEEEENKNKINWLNITLSDDAKQQLLIEEVGNFLVDIASQNKEAISNVRLLYDEYSKIIPEILEDYGITEYKQEVSKQVWGTLVRRSMQMQGICVENIDFNIIQDINPLGFLLRYTSGPCNVTTFEQLREAIQASRIVWRPFEDARDFVRNLGLKNQNSWYEYAKTEKRPQDIPVAPHLVYKKNWKGWGDFLGTGIIASQNRILLEFNIARKFAHSLKFSSKKEWYAWAKSNERPHDIPADPQAAYAKKGWNGWGDFLGTGIIAPQNRKFRLFEEAKKFAINLGFKNGKEWREFTKTSSCPKDLPTNPNKIYANDGWKGWGDFLGTGNIAKMRREFRSFEDARKFVRFLNFKSMKEYRAWTKSNERPTDIPVYPNETYEKIGWKGSADWLGKEKNKQSS